MNIVVSSLKDIKLTGTGNSGSKDLDSAKLFLAKSIEDNSGLLSNIRLTKGEITYPLIAVESPALEKTEYYGFRLTSRTSIPSGFYTFHIGNRNGNEKPLECEIEIENNEYLVDEHEAIYIIGRQINPITTQVVAEDLNSQQFTFYIKKKYDGVSFITEDKLIYADFIPVNKADLPEGVNFLSESLKVISDDVLPPDGQENEWIMLQWDLSYAATKTAGTVRFQISVINANGERDYTWQTLPSQFIVSANLAKRGDIVTPSRPEPNPGGEDADLNELMEIIEQTQQQVENLQQDVVDVKTDVNKVKTDVVDVQTDVGNLETLMGYQSNDDETDDKEILFVAGRPEEDEE